MNFTGTGRNASNTGIVHENYFSISRLSKVCPHCLCWFALQIVEIRSDRVAEVLHVYRCKHCGGETALPVGLPRRVLG